MAIVGFGFDRAGSGAGKGMGYTGLAYDAKYGLSISQWLDLNRREQELIIQDYNRSDAQATYYDDSLEAYAFDYVNYVDDKRQDIADTLDTGADIALGLGLVALALLFRR